MSSETKGKHANSGNPSSQAGVPEPTLAEQALALIRQNGVGTLSTLSRKQRGFPFGSLMPFALDRRANPIFLISTMAMHTQNLQADPRASLFVAQLDAAGDPLGAPRITLLGNVGKVPAAEAAEARTIYLDRHSGSRQWADFDDFSFYRMDVADVYYVGGFGVMGWISAPEYAAGGPVE